MHKTHHRRRRHHNRRTRRGGAHSTAHAASAAAGPAAAATQSPQLQAILARVRAYAATTPAPSSRKVKGISKSQAAKNRFAGIMEGKVQHSTKTPVSKHGSHNRPGPGQ